MLVDIDKETIDFLCKHKLTLNQLAICLFIHKKDGATIIRITEEVGHVGACLIPLPEKKYISEMDDLLKKGYLIRIIDDPKEPYLLDNFRLSPAIVKAIVTPIEGAAQEFFDAYPAKLVVNGIEYPARSCDFDEMAEKYLKAINNSITKHKEVMAKLAVMNQVSKYANVKLMNFIGGRMWNDIELEPIRRTRGY